jgi:hypothetical protein
MDKSNGKSKGGNVESKKANMAADTVKAKQKEVKSSHTCTQSNSDNLSRPTRELPPLPQASKRDPAKDLVFKDAGNREFGQMAAAERHDYHVIPQARKPPVLFRTCRESRREAMSSYEVRNFGNFISDEATYLVPYILISIFEQISCA